MRWVVGSILPGVDPLSYFSFQPMLHDWCNKGRGMCYPVCGMVHIKEPLLLIGKSSPCGGSGFPFSLSEWSFTIICPTPYNRTFLKCVECAVKLNISFLLPSFILTLFSSVVPVPQRRLCRVSVWRWKESRDGIRPYRHCHVHYSACNER